MKLNASLFSLPLLIALTASAEANTGNDSGEWGWETELQDRTWRPDTLSWAGSIHPNQPSEPLLLLAAAPPREMYCAYNTVPVQSDCDEFNDRLEDWINDFLGNAPGTVVDQVILDSFPEECITICTQ